MYVERWSDMQYIASSSRVIVQQDWCYCAGDPWETQAWHWHSSRQHLLPVAVGQKLSVRRHRLLVQSTVHSHCPIIQRHCRTRRSGSRRVSGLPAADWYDHNARYRQRFRRWLRWHSVQNRWSMGGLLAGSAAHLLWPQCIAWPAAASVCDGSWHGLRIWSRANRCYDQCTQWTTCSLFCASKASLQRT